MLIEMTGVSVMLGSHWALRDIHLQVASGGICGLIGPNGSGKSTLLRLLSGILPYEGQISLSGRDYHMMTSSELASRVSWVPQKSVMEFDYRAKDIAMLARYPRHHGRPGEADWLRVIEVFEQLEILPLYEKSMLALSGGEFHKVLIAGALASEADVLLLDEPFSDLDYGSAIVLYTALKSYVSGGKNVLMSLHNLHLTRQFCDTIIVIESGRILSNGGVHDTFAENSVRSLFRLDQLRLGH